MGVSSAPVRMRDRIVGAYYSLDTGAVTMLGATTAVVH